MIVQGRSMSGLFPAVPPDVDIEAGDELVTVVAVAAVHDIFLKSS
jgi:hypothetical protein